MNNTPVVRDVCLVGGGHSHVLLIRQWAMQPLPGVRLTLVSNSSKTPYSGMLPGLIAGHYGVHDIHIDLRNLCAWAGVRFVEQTMTDLNLQDRSVRFAARPALFFDLVSLDTGSTPDLSVPGAAQFTTPVKPVHDFHARWQHILERLQEDQSSPLSIGVVGSGAGGFELVTAMRHAIVNPAVKFYWFLRDELPLQGRPPKLGRMALRAAADQGIDIVRRFDVSEVRHGALLAADGRKIAVDEILWCTAASGPEWASRCGLSVDTRGFVLTNSHLQSVSHPFVFATGDIGTQQDTPSAKAGVFAVRQAPVLFKNLQRTLLGEPLVPYRPQKDFLSLMATGERSAIASRGLFVIQGKWVWRWKDRIDRAFMRRFVDLPPMMTDSRLNKLPDALVHDGSTGEDLAVIRCKGCGAKVSEHVLAKVIASLQSGQFAETVPSLSPAADAATFRTSSGSLVQSVDHLNAIIDDPYLLGRIAALHALSDVITLAAQPRSAQVLISLPHASESILERDLRLLMTGIVEALNDEGCQVIGGHTTEASEMSVGLVVNAILDQLAAVQSSVITDNNDDVLVLTKRIGTGVLFAGLMQQKAKGEDIDTALQSMLMSNRKAADILRSFNSRGMTDVTGFGLLGHLTRLIRGIDANSGATINLEKVPFLSGARALANDGVRSSLWTANRRILSQVDLQPAIDLSALDLLCDPQTSGGLLSIVPYDEHLACLEALRGAGYTHAEAIGSVNSSGNLSVH